MRGCNGRYKNTVLDVFCAPLTASDTASLQVQVAYAEQAYQNYVDDADTDNMSDLPPLTERQRTETRAGLTVENVAGVIRSAFCAYDFSEHGLSTG